MMNELNTISMNKIDTVEDLVDEVYLKFIENTHQKIMDAVRQGVSPAVAFETVAEAWLSKNRFTTAFSEDA